MRASSVSFSAIPHQSKLFLDYLSDPLSLKRYYPNAVSSHTDLSNFVGEVLANYRTDRVALCDALKELNLKVGAGRKTLENIDLLRDGDTVAVVTGQQAGLFTGPLYTIYKALSAIKLAEELKSSGTKAVPIFWVATEDHDFDEVSRTYLTGNTGELVKAEYHPKKYVKSTPVGNIQIGCTIDQAINQILNDLPQSSFSADVRDSIRRAWSDQTLFGDAFSKNITDILGRFGLVVIDPMHPGIKSLSVPVYVEAIEKSVKIIENIRQKSGDLVSDGFHAQVLVEDNYFLLFRIDDKGRRITLRRTGDGVFTAKEEKREFSLVELVAIAKKDPRRLSPGVMLRPVVQDYLLPTVCYFGGAAEVAYFAQNSDVYRILNRPVTPIMHRQSFTVVEAKHRRTLEKFGFVFADMFDGFARTLENVGRQQLSTETLSLFDEIEKTMEADLSQLDTNLSRIDQTLSDNLAKRRRKIAYHITALKKKTYLAATRNDDMVERKIRAAFDSLLPNGQLQERVLNVHSFLNKYGPHFVDMIYREIDLNDKGHRLVDL